MLRVIVWNEKKKLITHGPIIGIIFHSKLKMEKYCAKELLENTRGAIKIYPYVTSVEQSKSSSPK